MLVPAQLYKEELRNKIISTWYSLEYQYYWQSYNQEPNFDDNNLYGRQFAFVEDDKVTGYFSYSIDNSSKSLYNMGLLSFEKPNYHFIKAVTSHIKWLFDEKIIDRIEFFAYEDNPAIKGYDKMAERFGGKRAGKFTRSQKLYDGKLHNTIMYEILREDYENAKRGR